MFTHTHTDIYSRLDDAHARHNTLMNMHTDSFCTHSLTNQPYTEVQYVQYNYTQPYGHRHWWSAWPCLALGNNTEHAQTEQNKHSLVLLLLIHWFILLCAATGPAGEIQRTGQYGWIIWLLLMTVRKLCLYTAGGKQDSGLCLLGIVHWFCLQFL